MVVLTGFAQSLLAGLADHHALFGGLHAFDGLAILGIAAWLWARSRPRAPRLPGDQDRAGRLPPPGPGLRPHRTRPGGLPPPYGC